MAKMDIIQLLKNEETARKVFGKREIKIIEKQLLGINLTQSEKNRLSRDIRKKFEFIEKASRFSDDFNLKKGKKNKKEIEEAKEIILQDKLIDQIEYIFLFGSVVENKISFRSDIDIAIKFFRITQREATEFRKRIHGRVNERIDIQVYNYLPDKIRKQINNKGRILFRK
ncbi:MAG: nucleotidyltransferase domain-containing protein [Candidatus Woesearchaeota archaeon]